MITNNVLSDEDQVVTHVLGSMKVGFDLAVQETSDKGKMKGSTSGEDEDAKPGGGQ